MRDYFEAEIRLLHESAQAFARQHPEQAGMLNLSELRDRDPYIERLLEGMAYLTAQIRQHIDDDIPEISEAFLNHLWPRFLRAYPSATVVQFLHRLGQLQQSQELPSGTGLLSPPVGDDQVICRFATMDSVMLHPLRVQKVELEEPPGSGTRIRVSVQLDAGIEVADLELEELKFYLHADPAVALWLLHQLTAGLHGLRVSFHDHPTRNPHELDPTGDVVLSHLAGEGLPGDEDEGRFPGFRLLHDYFCFREKYNFVTVGGLDGIVWPDRCSGFDLEFTVKAPPPQDHAIGRDTFRVHCAPAVNLFRQEAEPIYLNHRRVSYPVIADIGARDGVRVHRVDKVTGVNMATGVRHDYSPMSSFRHRRQGGRFFYTSSRQLGGEHPELFLSVGGSELPARETLSCEVTANNGDYPRRYLSENGLSTPPSGFPSYASFRNLTRPTKLYEPPERKQFRWELISHLSLNFTSLGEPGVVQRILQMYEWTGEEQNQRRIDAISDVELEPVQQVRRGALMRGVQVRLHVDEKGFRSLSDIYLFGCVLHRFFSMYAALNCFVETAIRCYPSQEEMKWQPLLGENFPI